MNLPTIKYFQLQKIHEISEKLTNHIQALQTLVKLNKTNDYVRNTLNKLAVIRVDLLKNDKSARVQEWDFARFAEALHKQDRKEPCRCKKTTPKLSEKENLLQKG